MLTERTYSCSPWLTEWESTMPACPVLVKVGAESVYMTTAVLSQNPACCKASKYSSLEIWGIVALSRLVLTPMHFSHNLSTVPSSFKPKYVRWICCLIHQQKQKIVASMYIAPKLHHPCYQFQLTQIQRTTIFHGGFVILPSRLYLVVCTGALSLCLPTPTTTTTTRRRRRRRTRTTTRRRTLAVQQ